MVASLFSVILCISASCFILLCVVIPAITSDSVHTFLHSDARILWLGDVQNMTTHLEYLLSHHMPLIVVYLWTILKLTLTVVTAVAFYRLWTRPINRTRMLGDIGYIPYNGMSMKEMSAIVMKQRINGNLPPVFPNGWFAVLESRDLGPKESKSVSCLGLHLAVFRGEDGRAHIIDAYCPHLGANLAVGGQVKGSCLECPFHGWRFNGDSGKCTHIPYADKIPGQAAVKSYITLERNHFIYIWYDAEGREPSWEPEVIEQIQSGDLVYRGRSEHVINTHIEEIPENGADVHHLQQVHSASITAGTDLRFMNLYTGKFLKHIWGGAWVPGVGPEGKHIGTLTLTHKSTIFGHRVPKGDFNVTAKQIGPGIVHLTFHDFLYDVVLIQSVTPLEPMVQRLIHQVYVKWYIPPVLGNLVLLGEAIQVERDVMIWNNKRYNGKPLFVKSLEDSLLTRHRRWYSQFYSKNSPHLVEDVEGSIIIKPVVSEETKEKQKPVSTTSDDGT